VNLRTDEQDERLFTVPSASVSTAPIHDGYQPALEGLLVEVLRNIDARCELYRL
jgi:hypothetical protein